MISEESIPEVLFPEHLHQYLLYLDKADKVLFRQYFDLKYYQNDPYPTKRNVVDEGIFDDTVRAELQVTIKDRIKNNEIVDLDEESAEEIRKLIVFINSKPLLYKHTLLNFLQPNYKS